MHRVHMNKAPGSKWNTAKPYEQSNIFFTISRRHWDINHSTRTSLRDRFDCTQTKHSPKKREIDFLPPRKNQDQRLICRILQHWNEIRPELSVEWRKLKEREPTGFDGGSRWCVLILFFVPNRALPFAMKSEDDCVCCGIHF